jgi:hypothetical protein
MEKQLSPTPTEADMHGSRWESNKIKQNIYMAEVVLI